MFKLTVATKINRYNVTAYKSLQKAKTDFGAVKKLQLQLNNDYSEMNHIQSCLNRVTNTIIATKQALNGVTEYRYSLSRMVHHTLAIETRIVDGYMSIEDKKGFLNAFRNRIREIRRESKTLEGRWSGIDDKLIGGVRLEPGAFLKAFKLKKIQGVFKAKKPISKLKHIGIEIEFYSPIDRDDIAVLLSDAGIESNVTLKSDGSIDAPDGFYAHELAVIAPRPDLVRVLSAACAVLKIADAQVNASCGLHVHLDQRHNLTDSAWQNDANALIKAQNLLYKLVPSSRRKNKYCKRSRQIQTRNRYVAVNAQGAIRKFSTIEVRLHSSTVNFEKILNWIVLLESILQHADTINSSEFNTPRTVKGWSSVLGLGEELTSYFEARANKFKDASEVESNETREVA